MPSTKLGAVVDRARLARRERRGERRGGLASQANSRASGRSARARWRCRATSPPPPHGTRTASTSGKILDDLEPDRAVPGHDRAVADTGARTGRRRPAYARARDGLPPRRRTGTGTTRPPSRSIASSFVSGAWSGTTIVARHAEPPAPPTRRPAPCSRRSRSRRRPRAPRAAPPDRVARAADLERADRLQALELEPDLAGDSGSVEPDERRADRHAARCVSRARSIAVDAGSEVDLARRPSRLARPAHDELAPPRGPRRRCRAT